MDAGKSGHRFLDFAWFLVCAALSSVWCWSAARELGVTFDEPVYLARGLDHWRTGSHRGILKLGTMPLPIDVDTLPVYFWERWRGVAFDPYRDLELILPVARAGTLVFWWLLLGYGMLAGRQLAGPWGGRLAVALLACEPSLLAHAGLATTDIAVSACLLALVYHFRTGRNAGWFRRIAVPTFWFAAAVLAKASGLVFGLLCLLAIELSLAQRPWTVFLEPWHRLWARFQKTSSSAVPTQDFWQEARRFWTDLTWIGAMGLVLVFVYCGCDWDVEPSFVDWARQLPDSFGARFMVWFSEHLQIFSNAGEGLARQIKHNLKGHAVYLLGQWSPRAFWYYFPLALSIKLTLPILLTPVVLAIIRPRALKNWACWLAGILFLFSLTCRVQIGIRLVLPLIVFAVVGFSAALVSACRRLPLSTKDSASGGSASGESFVPSDNVIPSFGKRIGGPSIRTRFLVGSVVASVLWSAWSAWSVWPHGLCYTNELWGGTAQGYRFLSDSNYDWGQGLPELARWEQDHGRVPLDVWYFGTDPRIGKMPVRQVPVHVLTLKNPEDLLTRVRGHYFAVSTTLLYGSLLGEDPRGHQLALELLHSRRPIDRTTTFLIYDFTHEITAGEQSAVIHSPEMIQDIAEDQESPLFPERK